MIAVSVTGVAVAEGVSLGTADGVTGVGLNVGWGVLVGAATTMLTVSVDPKGEPACVPRRHEPVYVPGCFGAASAMEI